MRWPSLLIGVLLVTGATGWGWGWREHEANRESAFARQRLALLETENHRLADLVAARQRAQDAATERDRRPGIERQVAELRHLAFLQPIKYREIPREDLPRILREKLGQQIPDQEFGDTGVALAALGLLPPGLDLKKTYLDLLGEQIGAFYDQHSAELCTFSGNSLANAQNRVILAHELTHALEDQHFGLARLPLEAKGNDDRALAASALVEGDATLVMNRYMLGDLSADGLKDSLAGALATDVRKLAAAPRYLRASLLFPYLRGQEFCTALYEQGGWSALAAAFEHPPTSTAQILHPARYFEESGTEPPKVELGMDTVLGQKPIDDNVLGEFCTAQLLVKWLGDEKTANEVAAGWRGDRFRVYGDAKATSYLWKTDWSTETTATQFLEKMTQVIHARYSAERTVKTVSSSGLQENDIKTGFTVVASSPPHEVLLRRVGTWVTLIDAQNPAWSAALQRSETLE